MQTLMQTMTDGIADMGLGTAATREAIEESNLVLQLIAERLQLVADRIAETNQLMARANDQLGVLSQAAPRGSPSQAVRATRGDTAPYAQQHQ